MNDNIEARRAALRARFPVWAPVTLSEFLRRSAAEYGDRPFVLTDERAASYAEVDAWASELADGLAALGVRAGDRAGMLMANYLEFVPVKFAIARAGDHADRQGAEVPPRPARRGADSRLARRLSLLALGFGGEPVHAGVSAHETQSFVEPVR